MTPDQHTIKEFFIDVGDGHQLYVYEWGNKKAKPIIYVHGGPGSEIKDRYKESFDPSRHRVIFFDQRGCGKSLPYGSLEHNTTEDLIEDISKIADHLKLKQFILNGGSWGSGLALAYALTYPKRVKAMVLSSIFTASRRELDWIEQGHFKTHFPEVWERFLARTPKAHHKDPAAYHYKNILGTNERLVHSSGIAIEEMERDVMSLDDRSTSIDPTTFDPNGVKIFAHYFSSGAFMPDRYILNNAHKLTMPVWIVHGRFDMACPPISAYELDQELPNSKLIWAISSHRSEHENDMLLRTILLQLAEKV